MGRHNWGKSLDPAYQYFSNREGRFNALDSTNWLFPPKKITPIPLPAIAVEYHHVITGIEWVEPDSPWTKQTKVIKFVLCRDRENDNEIVNVALNRKYEPAILRTWGKEYSHAPYKNAEDEARAWGQQRLFYLSLRSFMGEYQHEHGTYRR